MQSLPFPRNFFTNERTFSREPSSSSMTVYLDLSNPKRFASRSAFSTERHAMTTW